MEQTGVSRKEPRGQTARNAHIPRFQLECVKDQILYRFRRGATEKSIAQKFGGSRVDVERVIREKCRELWAAVHGPDSWEFFAFAGGM